MFKLPLPLTCPGCGVELSATPCGCAEHMAVQNWSDIPRTLFGQSYWGECNETAMNGLLVALTRMHWTEALRTTPGCSTIYKHLTADPGPECVHGLPLERTMTVLDVGAGMGFLSARMADRARHVIALEAVPQRAAFLKARMAHDGVTNVYPLIASGTAIPFPRESFDLITLNGVFEYTGLWGAGDPKALQLRMLKQLHGLLRPGGYIYIGIETRFGLQWWRGGRDHSGLRYTSLLPRALANLYTWMRNAPIYGGQGSTRTYRTYTHTPRQYAKMLHQSGFKAVEVFGCFPGYNAQKGIYQLAGDDSRKAVRDVVDPCTSWPGVLRRAVTGNKLLAPVFEEEVIVLARKAEPNGALMWANKLATKQRVTGQVATADKVLWFASTGGKVQSILKYGRSPLAQQRLRHEHAMLTGLSQAMTQAPAGFRWPKPGCVHAVDGREVFEYEFVDGRHASSVMLSHRSARSVGQFLEGLVNSYVTMHNEVTAALKPSWPDLEMRCEHASALVSADLGSDTLNSRLATACERLHKRHWQPGVVHGDFALSNIIIVDEGSPVLIDWEVGSLYGYS